MKCILWKPWGSNRADRKSLRAFHTYCTVVAEARSLGQQQCRLNGLACMLSLPPLCRFALRAPWLVSTHGTHFVGFLSAFALRAMKYRQREICSQYARQLCFNRWRCALACQAPPRCCNMRSRSLSLAQNMTERACVNRALKYLVALKRNLR